MGLDTVTSGLKCPGSSFRILWIVIPLAYIMKCHGLSYYQWAKLATLSVNIISGLHKLK